MSAWADRISTREHPEREPAPSSPIRVSGGSAYGRAALAREAEALRTTGEGSRNDQLNRSAFAAGQLIAGGELAEGEARAVLAAAAKAAGLGAGETKKTLESGIRKGMQEPRTAPPRAPRPGASSNGRSASVNSEPDDALDAFGYGGGSDEPEEAPEPPEGRFEDEGSALAASVESSPLVSLGSLLVPAIERAEQRQTGGEKPVPVPFRDYSEALCGGFWPGVHTQVAGTGAGKSTYMFQCATFAARERVPVLYIGLELSQFQVALRALGEAAGVSWSKLYTGRGSTRDIERAREALPELTELPFYVEFGTAHGWAPSLLVTRAEQIRKRHPTGPMLVVLDFLQLVGSEPVAFGSAPDLRERIGRASYAGVHVANTLGASVVLISSSARAHYGLLAGDVKSAGLTTCTVPGHAGPVRTILGPDALLGLGKESGEIEYSAESQTVLVKWPAPLDNGERVVIAAVPKLRYGPPRWVPFQFWQRFEELPFQGLDDLPEVQGKGGKGAPVADDELEARVLATVRLHPNLNSKNDIAKNTTGTKQPILKAVDRLLASGKLTKNPDRFVVAGGANQ